MIYHHTIAEQVLPEKMKDDKPYTKYHAVREFLTVSACICPGLALLSLTEITAALLNGCARRFRINALVVRTTGLPE